MIFLFSINPNFYRLWYIHKGRCQQNGNVYFLCRRNWVSSNRLICNFGEHFHALCFLEVKIDLNQFSIIIISYKMDISFINFKENFIYFTRRESRNCFNLLIVALTCVDLVFCVVLMSDYCFVRTFGLSTNLYTMMFPYFVYPLVNITLTASIYMTVVLALER